MVFECACSYQHVLITGAAAVLGNPGCEFPGITMQSIKEAENCSPTPQKLALNLLTALFSIEELATENCTKALREDIQLLDQRKIEAI